MMNRPEVAERKFGLNFNKSSGQGLIEYSFIIVLIALVAIAVIALLGPAISDTYSQIIATI